MAHKQQEFGRTMFRALITQTNTDGSVKEINGVKLEGGVVIDNIGEILGYVYQDEKYDKEYNRKPETMVQNWYVEDEK